MTHMDDRVAKHIKQMIRRAIWKVPENEERPHTPDTLNRIIRTLRRGPDRVHGLIPPRCYPLQDDGSGPWCCSPRIEQTGLPT
jgi:hypothetical protein